MLVNTHSTKEVLQAVQEQTSGFRTIGGEKVKLDDNEIWYTQAFYCLGLEQVWARKDPTTGNLTPVPLPPVKPPPLMDTPK